ncbi:MAG TPA: glycosyltransferase [Saprospiraceae bacterium]|nr:glycosyltransferase [Saprospiraceae bacterium]
MNWLDQLIQANSDACEQFVYATYNIRSWSPHLKSTIEGTQSSYPIPWYNKVISKWKLRSHQRELDKLIRTDRIDLMHFHFGNVAILNLDWIARLSIPICVSLYGYDYEYLITKNPDTLAAYRKLASLNSIFIVEGRFSKSVLEGYGIPGNQIKILHMLFNRGVPGTVIPYHQPVWLFQAATFTEKKNQLGLLEALQDRHRSRFIIRMHGEIADANYYRELKRVIKSKPSHHIQIGGLLPFENYIQALRRHHFSINLSKRSLSKDTEGGCPVFLKDSLSLGKPVISTKHCDIPELVINEFNGYLLEENDIRAVTWLLDKLLHLSDRKYLNLCSNAKHGVESNLLQNLTRDEMLKIYKGLI